MSCDYPVAAWKSSTVNPSGKRSLQFKPQGSLSGIVQYVPCGRCIGCRLEKSREWAIRCVHESKMHPSNTFLTLTYDKEHLPSNGSVSVREAQLFMKKLRKFVFKKTGKLIRHYMCGEYGDLNKRPHYHALIFGYDFPDKLFYSTSGAGHKIYTSKLLDRIWGLGSCKVAELTFETAGYVARYAMKKVDGEKRKAGHYVVYDIDGVLHEREPEFAIMATQPGIATAYWEKYKEEIMAHDSLIINGKEVPSIRFYDKLFEALDAERFKRVKRARHPVAKYGRERFLVERTENRMAVKEALKKATVKQKARKL